MGRRRCATAPWEAGFHQRSVSRFTAENALRLAIVPLAFILAHVPTFAIPRCPDLQTGSMPIAEELTASLPYFATGGGNPEPSSPLVFTFF